MPLISTALSYFSMFVSRKMQPNVGTTQQAASQAQTMKTMMYVMPLMSLWIGFVMPAAMSVYWVINSVMGILRETGLTLLFRKQMAKEDESSTPRSARGRRSWSASARRPSGCAP